MTNQLIILFIPIVFSQIDLIIPSSQSITQSEHLKQFKIIPTDSFLTLLITFSIYIDIPPQFLCNINFKDPNQQVTFIDQQSQALLKSTRYISFTPSQLQNSQTISCSLINYQQDQIIYSIQLESYPNQPCPMNCNKNGSCQEGICICEGNFIDIDCSTESQIVAWGENQSLAIYTTPFFINIQSPNSLNQTQQISFNSEDNLNIYVNIEDENHLIAPSYLKNFIQFTINQNQIQQNLVIKGNTITFCKQLKKVKRIIIGIFQNKDEFSVLQLSFSKVQQNQSSNNTGMMIMYFVFGVLGICLLTWLIIYLYRNREQKEIQVQAEQQFQVRLQQSNEQLRILLKNDKKSILNDELLLHTFMPICQYKDILEMDIYIKKLKNLGANEDECMICLANFILDDELRNTYCFHYFHKGCLEQWLEKFESCPICRKDFSVETLKGMVKNQRQNNTQSELHYPAQGSDLHMQDL